MTEIWKDIETKDIPIGNYQISNLGRVKSLKRKVSHKAGSKRTIPERMMTQHITRRYVSVHLRAGGNSTYRVHRLVALAFIPNPENKPQVNHIDGNIQNNFVTNLEWVTASENIKHAIQTGLINHNSIRGTRGTKAKLNDWQVRIIRRMKGDMSNTKIGEYFNVTQGTISAIQLGNTWKHLLTN